MVFDDRLFDTLQAHLRKRDFKSIRRVRNSLITVDGAVIRVAATESNSKGEWKVNWRGKDGLDESGIDAYLFMLLGVPGTSQALYLIFPAPLKLSAMRFSFRTLLKVYAGNIDAWETLREVTRKAIPAA